MKILDLGGLLAVLARLLELAPRARREWRRLRAVVDRLVPSVDYETLSLELDLELLDVRGERAVLRRVQRVRFLRHSGGVVRDLTWGEGDTLARYTSRDARRLDTQAEGSRRAVILGLSPRPQRDDRVTIRSRRLIRNGFTRTEEYLETLVERTTARISLRVRFPQGRPPEGARIESVPPTKAIRVPMRYLPDGRAVIEWRARQPKPFQVYSLRWSW